MDGTKNTRPTKNNSFKIYLNFHVIYKIGLKKCLNVDGDTDIDSGRENYMIAMVTG